MRSEQKPAAGRVACTQPRWAVRARVPGVPVRGGRRSRRRPAAVLALAAAGGLALAGCSAGVQPARAPGPTNGPASPSPASASGSPVVSLSPAGAATPSPVPARVTDHPCACLATRRASCLPLSRADLHRLRELYLTARRIPGRDVAGLDYSCGATLISTGVQWASASFVPSSRVSLTVGVGFQDGGATGVYQRVPGGSWQFLGLSGEPFACSPSLHFPAALRPLWHISPCTDGAAPGQDPQARTTSNSASH
jgi:hypothetical protein